MDTKGKYKNMVLIGLLAIVFTSCQKPVLNVRNLHAPVLISTENVNFYRNNFLPVVLTDSLTWIKNISLNSTTTSTLCLVGSNLVFSTHNGFLYSLDGKTLNDKHDLRVGKWMTSAPTISNGIAFVASSTGKYGLIAYDLFRGKVLWKEYGGLSDGAPFVFDAFVYHLTSDGSILMIDKHSGKTVKELFLGHAPVGSIAGNAKTLFVACKDGHVLSFDLKTSGQIWSFDMDGAVYSSPILVNDSIVVVGNYSGKLMAFSAQTGRIFWQRTMTGNIQNPLSADQERIYVSTTDGRVRALSAKNGAEFWTYTAESPPCVPMLVTKEKIWISTGRRWLHILDKSSGKEIRGVLLPGRPSSMPAAMENKIFIGIDFRKLAVYEVIRD